MQTSRLLLAAAIPALLAAAPTPATAAAHQTAPATAAAVRVTPTTAAVHRATAVTARSAPTTQTTAASRRTALATTASRRTGSATAASRRTAALAPSCPVVIAHRTAGADAPENTVPGIGVAKSLGAGTVEIDIRFSRSNFAFAMHDEDVSRTTNGTGRVQDLWLADLQKLTAADYAPWNTDPRYGGFKPDGTPKVRPPYTYEFLDAAKKAGVKLLLDVKVTPTKVQADSFVGYLDRPEFRMRDRIIWMANSESGLRTMRGWYPDLTYYLIERPPAGFMRTGDSLKAMGATTYAVPIGDVRSAAFVDYYHAYGLKVSTWTSDNASLDTPANWSKARTYGVDYLTTDHPDDALAHQGGPTC